ncbi:MAG: rhodanese-like domain-containing protein, partial [Acidobacteriota bacterium]
MTAIADRGYRHPDALVSTEWVAEHASDPNVRIIESNEDTLLYAMGHLPGAVHVDWTSDLNDQVRRDYVEREGFEALMGRIGVTPDTTVVFYGDKNNWWACYAFWVFQLFGHTKAHIMDGGRVKWQKEARGWSTDTSALRATTYKASDRDDARKRILRDDMIQYQKGGGQLVDVRSPEEFAG